VSDARPVPGGDGAPPAPAVLRVVSGRPDAEELAAVTAVLLALEADAAARVSTAPDAATRSTGWERAARRGRPPVRPGPGAWRGFTG